MSYRVKISLSLGIFFCFMIGLLLSDGFSINSVVTSINEFSTPIIVIDAGHGGVDPGAVKGNIYEKDINLSIALKFRDLCKVLGFETVMIRTEDISVHDKSAENIRDIKVTDLKNRVKLANSQDNALLISIHQNMFEISKYYGTQVFFGVNENSEVLALNIQNTVVEFLQPNNARQIKNGKNLFILENANLPAVMVECGFMSNEAELNKLTDEAYQTDFAYALAIGILRYIEENGNVRET